MGDGYGTVTWWGFSPLLDLQDKDVSCAFQDVQLSESESGVINILLVGAGDCRHILQTIAKSYRWPKKKLNFYLLENNFELYARDMLLMMIALEPQTRMGLQEKTELFLEVYGNILIRKKTCEYIEKISNELIKMVTDFDYMEERMPVIDMSLLKFKERDFLEGIFKFWRNPDTKLFDAVKCWELRLRHYLQVRYDTRKGVFDWDYNMRLVEYGASIIHKIEYYKWRESGVAYEIREGNYDTPNKTLASGRVLRDQEGERVARRGYWGDIVVSPYICFGTEAEDKELFKLANKSHVKTSSDVSEYNIISILHEIATKTKYVPPKTEDTTNTKESFLTEIQEEEEDTSNIQTDTEAKSLDVNFVAIPVEDVKVYFLPQNSVADIHKKSRFQKLFDVVFFSNSMVQHLTSDITEVFADKASVILESSKFLLDLKKEHSEEFAKKITSIAESVGCKAKKDFHGLKDAFGYFTYTR